MTRHAEYMRELRARDPEYAERLRQQSRDAKRRRRGVCTRCGGETRYSGHGVSQVCATCNGELSAQRQHAKIGTGPMHTQVLAYLRQERSYSEIARHFGKSKGWTSGMLHRWRQYGLIVRVRRGVYIAASAKESA